MVQEAIITKLLPDNMAEVAVVRATACGKNCSSCESCIFQNELKVIATNRTGSKPGHKVLIETESSKVFGAVFLVYLLPMFSLVLGYMLAATAALSESICIASAFAGLAVGLLVMVVIHRLVKNNTLISYTVIKQLT